jgi:hypothetical protein
MTHKQAQEWIAFLMQIRGQSNVFQLGDLLAATPQGTPSGTPVTNGTQFGYQLVTRGWTENAANVLLPGDWIQVGYRLYRNLDVVNADATGNATLNIWPQLRELPTDGTAVITSNTKGLWRLSANQRRWSANEAKIYGISLNIREAT